MKGEKIINYANWMGTEYISDIPDITNVTSIKKVNYLNGSAKRVYNISTMKYKIWLNMANITAIVLKLYDNNIRKQVNYGILFAEKTDNLPDVLLKQTRYEYFIGNIAVKYYSISPSFVSCDGEYRNKFCSFGYFNELKTVAEDLWVSIENYIEPLIDERKWHLSTLYFYDDGVLDKEKNYDMEKSIKNDLIPKTMLILSWFHTIFNEFLSQTELNTNTTYKEIFLLYSKKDFLFMKKTIENFKFERVAEFIDKTTYYVDIYFGDYKRHVPLGYKLIPLSIKEFKEPLNIQYKPWKEYYTSIRCSNCIINKIAPNFPIILDWNLIKNVNKGLFDNQSQFNRMKNSELAKDMYDSLSQVKKSTYLSFDITDNNEDKSDAINNKFKRFITKIDDTMTYLMDEIIMSNNALMIPSEFVGKPIMDVINIAATNKEYNIMIGNIIDNYNTFAKYMFEICYGLLALNKKVGAIHGDLHLNNCTIGMLYKTTVDDNFTNVICYNIDDSHYIFNNNGYFASIIDLSRVILNPNKSNDLLDDSIKKIFVQIKNYAAFSENEITNLLNLYITLFPAKAENKEQLYILFKNNIDIIFNLLTCIDVYMFSSRLITIIKKRMPKINDKSIKLLEEIYSLAETYITNDINYLLENPDSVKDIPELFPIQVIIEKCFADFIGGDKVKTNKKELVCTDYYNLNNEFKYNLLYYDSFPKAFKDICYLENKKIHCSKKITNLKKDKRKTYEKRRMETLEQLKFSTNAF